MLPDPLLRGAGMALRPSCLHSKHFTDGVSSALLLISTFKYLLFPFLKESKTLLTALCCSEHPDNETVDDMVTAV